MLHDFRTAIASALDDCFQAGLLNQFGDGNTANVE